MVSRNKARTVFVVGGVSSLAPAVILAPASSSRNLIVGTGNFTELTVKAAVGQTLPILIGQDENGSSVFVVSPSGDVVAHGTNMSLGDPVIDNVFAGFDWSPNEAGMALFAATADFTKSVDLFADSLMNSSGTPWFAVVEATTTGLPGESTWSLRLNETFVRCLLRAVPGQTEPMLFLRDENGNPAHRLGQTDAGFFGVSPVTQRALITNPTGGAIIDAESRTAITAINTLLKAYGLEAAA